MPADLEPIAAFGAAVVLGPVFGSFVTALSYRLPRGENIAHGRSRCPKCAHALAARDLVPIVSWLGSRGKCRHCGGAISPRYPIIETLSLALFVATAALLRDPARVALAFCFIPVGLTLAIVDFEHQRLPNILIALLLPFALLWRWHSGFSLGAGVVTGAVTYAGLLALDQILIWRTGESGLGGGDAKMIALAALCLPLLPFFIGIAFAGASGIGLGLWWRRRTGQRRFPFGINILLAWWLCLVLPLPVV